MVGDICRSSFESISLPSAAGYGFGLISGTFAIVNVLSDMIGPGTIGIFGHSQDFFLATGNRSDYDHPLNFLL